MTWKEYMMDLCGYETKTTFWDDFTIAEAYGESAVKDTYNRAFKEWKTNVEYITEFVMVLNHKMFQPRISSSGISYLSCNFHTLDCT